MHRPPNDWRMFIALSALIPALASPAQAQEAPRRITVGAGVDVPMLVILSPPRGSEPPAPILAAIGLSAGILVAPSRRSGLRVAVEFDWHALAFEYRLSDVSGRTIYADVSIRDSNISQLVGVHFAKPRHRGVTLFAGVAQVFRRFKGESFSNYQLPPTHSLRTGSFVAPGFVLGFDVPLGTSERGAVFRLRSRWTSVSRPNEFGAGWMVRPGVSLWF
jgi:hypothetical protein